MRRRLELSRHSSFPLRASIARNLPSIVAPMNTSLPAVVIAAAETWRAGLDALGLECLELAERNPPGDVPCVRVDRNQLAPRRRRHSYIVLRRPRTARLRA